MKIIRTLIAVLLIQTVVQAQTLPEAKKAIESEYYFKAKKILLSLNSTTPTVESNYYLGNVYLLTNKVDSAKYYFSKAGDFVENKNALIFVAKGKVNLLNNKPAEAKLNFDDAIKVSKSKNAEIFYQIGDAYYKINNAEAIKNYEIAYSTDPTLIINLLAYGDAYLDMDDPGKAMTKYEQAEAANPNIAVTHLRIGRVHAKTGKHKEAIEEFLKTIQHDPNIAVVWKELGEEYYLDGQFDKVRACFNKYVELNAEDKEARIVPAVTCYQIGDYICAIEEARKIIADDPSNFIAWRIIYYANYELGDTLRKTDAEAALLKFTEGYEASQTFWNIAEKKVQPLDYQYSAKLAVEMKSTTKAVFYYTMAIENDTNTTVEVFTEYAKYLYSTKKYPEAIVAYNNAITKFGGGPLDFYFLGRAYFLINDYVNADTTFAQFIIMQPNSPDGYLQRAKTKLKIEEEVTGEALPYYLKFIELAEKDIERNRKTLIEAYSYCCTYYALVANQKTEACIYYNKVIELDPTNAYILTLELECRN